MEGFSKFYIRAFMTHIRGKVGKQASKQLSSEVLFPDGRKRGELSRGMCGMIVDVPLTNMAGENPRHR